MLWHRLTRYLFSYLSYVVPCDRAPLGAGHRPLAARGILRQRRLEQLVQRVRVGAWHVWLCVQCVCECVVCVCVSVWCVSA